MKRLIVIAVLAIFSLAFQKPWQWEQTIPAHFPDMKTQRLANLSPDKIELGRVLFYDPGFSADGITSCASCHSPYNAFAHTDHNLSHGVFDSVGTRNAPALFNLAWQDQFMVDGSAHNLEAQALAPLSSKIEMGSSAQELLQYMKRTPVYKSLFQKAFGKDVPNVADALEALSAFQLSLISAESDYDRMLAGELEFNSQQLSGYRIFQKECSSCHQEPLFSSYQFERNGLSPDPVLQDEGRFRVTGDSADLYHFKVPSLRNLKYTYPYMHDGRFSSLRQVLDHYSPGDGNLSSSPLSAPLSDREKADLIAFLKTLNDPNFVFNTRHAYPRWVLSFNSQSND